MQPLYVVEADVTATGAAAGAAAPTGSAAEAVVGHVAAWLAQHHEGAPGAADLAEDGFTVAPLRGSPDVWHDIAWRTAGEGGVGALRLDLHEPLASGARLTTRVTVSQPRLSPGSSAFNGQLGDDDDSGSGGASGAHLRVVLGREVTTGRLAPARVEHLEPPRLVAAVLGDPRLRCTALGRPVTGRCRVVRDAADVPALVADAHAASRLPMLLVSPLGQAGWRFARSAAGRLTGLAEVAVLASREAADALRDLAPELAAPVAGARLVWPDLDAHEHPTYQRSRVEDDALLESVFRDLAALAVVAHGRDEGWSRAVRAAQRGEGLRAQRQVDAARRAGDGERERTAVVRQVDALQHEVEQWMGECEKLIQEVDGLRAQAGAAAGLRHQAEAWKARYLDLVATAAQPEVADWSAAPALDAKDAGPLLAFLEERSGGTCVFTKRAARSWRKSGYACPERMREALVALARASVDFAAQQGCITERLSEWFLSGHGLDVALSDSQLADADRWFAFGDARLDGLPHVKLGDAKQPRECGRIHFAHQSVPARFVVDHIGLHR